MAEHPAPAGAAACAPPVAVLAARWVLASPYMSSANQTWLTVQRLAGTWHATVRRHVACDVHTTNGSR